MSDTTRFEAKVERVTESGCWLWTGCLSKNGYAKFFYAGTLGYGHRFAWQSFRGPIPEGLVIDHLCRVRCCVNPAHLRTVTPATNTLENSVSASARHAAKDRCGVCGEPYSPRHDRNARTCPRCNAERCRGYRTRNLDRLRAYDRARRKTA